MAGLRSTTLSRWPFFAILATITSILFLGLGLTFLRPAYGLSSVLTEKLDTAKQEIKAVESKYFEWETQSAFNPVSYDDDWKNLSTADLCASFPVHLLQDIQPVLKTGHGVIESRVRPQISNGLACLDNLLIFSEVSEEVDGRHLIDVLADIPEQLLNETEQTEPYRRLKDCTAAGRDHCDGVLSHDDAWKTDKFKFLPAISRAWKMSPEKRWYIFFEADSYLVWDNVFRLLSNFDPDTPLYFGSPAPGRDGAWFAYGGSGYIISRAAMRELIKDDWDSVTGDYLGSKLTERYWKNLLNDCCGDSAVGWALHDNGVDLSGLWPMFSPHPPHGVPFSSLYWCQPLIGMHKPNEDEVHNLWRWQYGHRTYDVGTLSSASSSRIN